MRKILAGAVILSIALSGAYAKKNPYMTRGTEEYKNVTEKVIGTWEMNSYNRSDRGEQIPGMYKKATLELIAMEKDGKRGNAVWKFYLSDSVVNDRSKAEREKDPALKVDNYIVKFNSSWDIYDKEPNLIRFSNDEDPELEIIGSGSTIADFISGQNGQLGGSKALGGIGGAAGFIAEKAAKAGSGLNDITAELPFKANFVLKDNAIDLTGNGNLLFKAVKQN